MHRYRAYNGASPTTAAIPAVATGTAIKTMLQLATPTDRMMQIISWGYSIDAAQAGVVELIQTDVAATVTAHAASGLVSLDPNAPPSKLSLGVAASGFTGSAEGAITATRTLDIRTLPSTTDMLDFRYQFMPDERPLIPVSKFLRVRATFGTTTNMRCWICWDE